MKKMKLGHYFSNSKDSSQAKTQKMQIINYILNHKNRYQALPKAHKLGGHIGNMTGCVVIGTAVHPRPSLLSEDIQPYQY